MTIKNKECLLCGKSIRGEDGLCDDCIHSVDNQYDCYFLADDNAQKKEDDTHEIKEEVLTKKRISKSIIFFIIICITVTTFGILASLNLIFLREDKVAEDYYWQSCLETDSQLSYSKYLVAYPEGKYVNVANELIQKLKDEEYSNWILVKNTTNVNDLFDYIKFNPSSMYIDSAKYLVDSTSWNNALSLGTLDAINTYLSSIDLGVVNGTYKEVALDKLDYLSTIRSLDSLSIEKYIKPFLLNLYISLEKKDSIELENILFPQIYFNSDTVKKESIQKYFLDRLINKDSIRIYSPNLNSINGCIDRDSVMFLSYIETTIVESKPIKKKDKIFRNAYSDTIFITLNKSMKIIELRFK